MAERDFSERLAKMPEENKPHINVIYEQHMEWARHFDNLIWISFSIIAPLSLAGLTQYDEASPVGLAIIGIGSIVLITGWHLIAEGQRRNWRDRFRVTDAIERHWLLRDQSDSFKPLAGSEPRCFSVREVRKGLVILIIVVWLISCLIKILSTICTQSPACTPSEKSTREKVVSAYKEIPYSASAHRIRLRRS